MLVVAMTDVSSISRVKAAGGVAAEWRSSRNSEGMCAQVRGGGSSLVVAFKGSGLDDTLEMSEDRLVESLEWHILVIDVYAKLTAPAGTILFRQWETVTTRLCRRRMPRSG
nr:hypothetical protein CFP56_20700 [Quercus suber]